MGDTTKGKKRWFLKAELALLVCVFCIWLTTLVAANFDGVEAAVIKGIVERNPNNANEHELPVNIYLESRDYEEAADAHKQVMRIKKEINASAHLMLGDAYCDADRPEGESESYNTATRSDPDSFEAHDNLASAQTWLDRYEDAIEFLEEVTRITADDADAHLVLGSAYYDANYPEEAIAAYKQAADGEPDRAQAHYNLAEVDLRMGNKTLALEEYETLKTLDEELADALYELID